MASYLHLLSIFMLFLLAKVFSDDVTANQQFHLKRQPDGTFLLVPTEPSSPPVPGQTVPPNPGQEVPGETPKQQPIPVTNKKEDPGLNSLSLKQPKSCPPDDSQCVQNIMTLALKGKDGVNGKSGLKGPDGDAGPPGMQGPMGPKGPDGSCDASKYQCSAEIISKLEAKIAELEAMCKNGGGGGGGAAEPPKKCPLGTCAENPAGRCQQIYKENPSALSGTYWIKADDEEPWKTHCQMIRQQKFNILNPDRPQTGLGGWTLVARMSGSDTDFSPISNNWKDTNTFNDDSSDDVTQTSSMKNKGYSTIKSDALLLCMTGSQTGCAPFTHNRGMTLSDLYSTQFGVVPLEQYTFATLMKALGKTCDLSVLKEGWCGLNLADICHPEEYNPNESPVKTQHIVRLGCIGDNAVTCFPDDYGVGVGVGSCRDGHGCTVVGETRNMQYRCDYVAGSFSHTGFLYVI